jgi:carboxylesterase type B
MRRSVSLPSPAGAGTAPVSSDEVTAADKAMGDLVSVYWVAFGKTGDPNGEVDDEYAALLEQVAACASETTIRTTA